ncbi:methyltransferase domain-containing protein [Streptoalloteichus hindustanus]|uniref:Methyltransferase domain-containing protein n=1 Tax=Streptoalloteichus hindustanus TaxID=2017 RepID=A0A1M4XI16_STRHI|nr:methyltransferase domain-containing protein [Streptoalloteichus hindustanus]SHE93155.1 Methyltransferase domain-containing protein [Streptoalloteichus hindustanus]
MTTRMFAPSEDRVRRWDEHLAAATAELLKYDDRVRGMEVEVRFAGGVAHLTGALDRAEHLAVLRDLIGRLDGVTAVWDRVVVAGREPVVLDLGCGATKQYPGNVGVDQRLTGAVDVLADLSDGLPFADGSVDRVFTVHVLEHLVDFLPLVDECHRVLRPGGVLHVLAPWWRHVNAVADPTHVRLLDIQTIKGICVQPGRERRWRPLHAACDGATVFADLTPVRGPEDEADAVHMARFFD